MSKLFLAICAALPLAAAAWGQTASELANKYPHHEVYEVQPGIQMTAKFASNGLVCEMQIEQAHFGKDEMDLSNGIDEERIPKLLDLLVPPSERGEKDNYPGHNIIISSGQVMDRMDSYSNVTVQVSSSHGTIVIEIKWRHRTC